MNFHVHSACLFLVDCFICRRLAECCIQIPTLFKLLIEIRTVIYNLGVVANILVDYVRQ